MNTADRLAQQINTKVEELDQLVRVLQEENETFRRIVKLKKEILKLDQILQTILNERIKLN